MRDCDPRHPDGSEAGGCGEVNLELANEELSEAQQRFQAGVADNLPVSQAQSTDRQAKTNTSARCTSTTCQAFAGARAGCGVRRTKRLSGRKVSVADTERERSASRTRRQEPKQRRQPSS